ncbi:MAG: signal recognition particle-docking protein FtsY [Alphaproteobacteria bacterium]|nr:signal recognition particle-docking protein FtsY [Alphaproteobacteria bacterium]
MTGKSTGWLVRLRDGLNKSSSPLVDGIKSILNNKRLESSTLQELEDLLISSDLGIKAAEQLTKSISNKKFESDISSKDVQESLANDISKILEPVAQNLEAMKQPESGPQVILVVGTNGSGKTTTIGKLAHKLNAEGKSIVLAAGDTFRAAAIDQLTMWGNRSGSKVISQGAGSDPASVAFEALEFAKNSGADTLLIDTAGRLHNKSDLMAELEKIIRVINKSNPSAPHEVLLVLDATTGQNAIIQVKKFQEIINITGLIITKLDGSAKGGIIVSLADLYGLPIFAIGVGEGPDDLNPFTAQNFSNSLLNLPSK